jgi:hypothetical protein
MPLSTLRRLQLDQVLNLEAIRTQKTDPVAVAEVKVDGRIVRPLEAVHPEVRAPKLLVRRDLLLLEAEHEDRAVDEEHELAPRSQQPRSLRDPEVRIGPDRRAVLRDDEIERLVRERHRLGARLEQRELEAELHLHRARGLELRGSDVDSRHTRALPGEPGGEVRRPAPQLDDVLAGHVRQRMHLGIRNLPDAPGDLVLRPGSLGAGRVLRRQGGPGFAVPLRVLAQRHLGAFQICSIGQR